MTRSSPRARGLAEVLALLALAPACASYANLRYGPSPQDVELRADDETLEARIHVGFTRVEEREGLGTVTFHVTLENPGSTTFALVPAEFELLDGARAPFEPGVAATLPVVLEPGSTAESDVVFALPAERTLADVDRRELTFHLRLQGGRFEWAALFQRVVDSGWGAFGGFGFFAASSPGPPGGHAPTAGFSARRRL